MNVCIWRPTQAVKQMLSYLNYQKRKVPNVLKMNSIKNKISFKIIQKRFKNIFPFKRSTIHWRLHWYSELRNPPLKVLWGWICRSKLRGNIFEPIRSVLGPQTCVDGADEVRGETTKRRFSTSYFFWPYLFLLFIKLTCACKTLWCAGLLYYHQNHGIIWTPAMNSV